jgi:uncharacterized protein YecT (DUF1311 family)
MRLILTVIIFCTVLSSFAVAQTQGDINEISCRAYRKADAELNKTYKRILTDYKDDGTFIKKLKSAQNAWLKYRDAHVESIYPEADKLLQYGSVFGMCNCDAMKKLTEQRTAMLMKWIDGVQEGDVCSGSIKWKDGK